MNKSVRLVTFCIVLALFLPSPTSSVAISAPLADSHTFPETGHTVSGSFWTYWQAHGGLAQQGYPISEELQEKSDLNGQTYTVQYFERAVFEKHPENQPPYDVLLSQLGTFLYQAKYAQVGPPSQQTSTTNPQYFPQTGHTLGGKFRTYWEQHGGLAQQGYPISDEFTEVSDLNSKVYTVQYFERAVFELHPENASTPYEVLLSQLGTFRYHDRYVSLSPTSISPPATAIPTPAAANGKKYDIPGTGVKIFLDMHKIDGSAVEYNRHVITADGKPGEQVIYETLLKVFAGQGLRLQDNIVSGLHLPVVTSVNVGQYSFNHDNRNYNYLKPSSETYIVDLSRGFVTKVLDETESFPPGTSAIMSGDSNVRRAYYVVPDGEDRGQLQFLTKLPTRYLIDPTRPMTTATWSASIGSSLNLLGLITTRFQGDNNIDTAVQAALGQEFFANQSSIGITVDQFREPTNQYDLYSLR